MCLVCHAPHTPLTALMSWRNFAAQKQALTELHLTQQCLVCRPCHDDISHWQDGQKYRSNLGWKRKREGQIVASLCIAILHLPCQNCL